MGLIFLTKDPIGFAGGDVNLNRYVANNPINEIDPLGLFGWADMPTIPQPVSDIFAGFGDTLTSGFGLTSLFGLPSAVRKGSVREIKNIIVFLFNEVYG